MRRVGEKTSMVETITWRKKDGLMKEIMVGKMEGKRGPGRKCIYRYD